MISYTHQPVTYPPASEWTIITFDDFENGLENFAYEDVGVLSDVSKIHAHQGTSALQICDITGSASSASHKQSHDVTQYNQLRVNFWYYPESIASNDDRFFLEYSSDGGALWFIVKLFPLSVDYVSSQFYEVTVYLDREHVAFSTQSRLRFRCDLTDSGNAVSIDEIEFAGEK